jgi:CheY-like chemotaxis protein
VQGNDGGALRILAMDDDPTTLRLLRLTLKDIGGFDAVIVTSAREALEQMKAREFDAVISDAMMPDMNGKEFCEHARQLGGWATRVPIVILSAATSDELGWRDGLSGPVEWMRKPFMPSGLVRDIARVVEAHRRRSR